MDRSSATPDAALVAALADGDLGALRTLYERHAPWLSVRLARRCGGDADVVADALQDTFTAVWREAGRWSGQGEVAAWLWGIAVRRLISRLRRERPATLPLRDDAGPAPAVVSAEETVLLGIEHGGLAPALDRLGPELRAVLQARVLDGLSTREASRLLGIPANTVKTRLHRAKQLLRADLARSAGPHPETAGGPA